jgi:hypothetical protein
MQFLFKGFQQMTDQRRFLFEGVEGNYSRQAFVITTDVKLFTKHRVHLQDGPLMCLHLLETREPAVPQAQVDIVLTEEDILTHVRARLADQLSASLRRKKPPRGAQPPEPAEV